MLNGYRKNRQEIIFMVQENDVFNKYDFSLPIIDEE